MKLTGVLKIFFLALFLSPLLALSSVAQEMTLEEMAKTKNMPCSSADKDIPEGYICYCPDDSAPQACYVVGEKGSPCSEGWQCLSYVCERKEDRAECV